MQGLQLAQCYFFVLKNTALAKAFLCPPMYDQNVISISYNLHYFASKLAGVVPNKATLENIT